MDGRPIVIQGAMNVEIEYLKSKINNLEELSIYEYKFYKGYINDYPVIINKTEIGVVNAALSTMLAIEKFDPYCIINQGVAGSHKLDIKKGDIIIAKDVANINSFSTEKLYNGIEPLKWNLKMTRLANDEEKQKLESDEELLKIFSNNDNTKSVYCGTIGSGDVWNRETDRIKQISDLLGTLCEDMESIGTYTTSYRCNAKVIGVRCISNNEMTGEEYDRNTAIECQKFVYDKIVELINMRR